MERRSLSQSGAFRDVLTLISQHHELCDGSGYPKKLRQQDIHPLARTLALVDHRHAVQRVTAGVAHTPHEALALMFSQLRNKFDSQPLNTFIRCMGVYPPGSLVMLSNEAYALVVSVNSSRPLKPQVLVHVPGMPPEETPLIDLEQEADLEHQQIAEARPVAARSDGMPESAQADPYFFAPKEDD